MFRERLRRINGETSIMLPCRFRVCSFCMVSQLYSCLRTPRPASPSKGGGEGGTPKPDNVPRWSHYSVASSTEFFQGGNPQTRRIESTRELGLLLMDFLR